MRVGMGTGPATRAPERLQSRRCPKRTGRQRDNQSLSADTDFRCLIVFISWLNVSYWN